MLYDLKKSFEANAAGLKLQKLIEKGAKIELTEKKPKRTLRQNSYLHATITQFAVEYGERREYVKQRIFKELVNPEMFITEHVNRLTGEVRPDLRSTAELTTEEMNLAIERFRNYANENGIYIMDPEEYLENTFYIQQLEQQNKIYL